MAERNARRPPKETGLAVSKVVAARQLPRHGSVLACRVLASQVLGPSTIAHDMYNLHVVTPKGTAADKLSEETLLAMNALQVSQSNSPLRHSHHCANIDYSLIQNRATPPNAWASGWPAFSRRRLRARGRPGELKGCALRGGSSRRSSLQSAP